MSDQEKRGVWVIEEGEYSGYHVVGVFSTKENAELIYDAIREAGGRGPGGYDSLHDGPTFWELDPGVDQLRAGHKYFEVKMLRDGTVDKCVLEGPVIDGEGRIQPDWYGLLRYTRDGAIRYLWAKLWAKDETQAVKAANEHRAMMIANGEWDA